MRTVERKVEPIGNALVRVQDPARRLTFLTTRETYRAMCIYQKPEFL